MADITQYFFDELEKLAGFWDDHKRYRAQKKDDNPFHRFDSGSYYSDAGKGREMDADQFAAFNARSSTGRRKGTSRRGKGGIDRSPRSFRRDEPEGEDSRWDRQHPVSVDALSEKRRSSKAADDAMFRARFQGGDPSAREATMDKIEKLDALAYAATSGLGSNETSKKRRGTYWSGQDHFEGGPAARGRGRSRAAFEDRAAAAEARFREMQVKRRRRRR